MSGVASSPGSVPPAPRLAFKIVREPLDSLTGAIVANLERGIPADITAPLTLGGLVLLMTKVAEATFNSIRHLCGDEPTVDSDRRLPFALSVGPLLRSLVEEIFTLIYLADDPRARMRWYLRAGWRAERMTYERLLQRFKGMSPDWDSVLTQQNARLLANQALFGVTAQEAEDPTKRIRPWPRVGGMIKTLQHPENRSFLEYLEAWFYRDLSQAAHLGMQGLVQRGMPFMPRFLSYGEHQYEKIMAQIPFIQLMHAHVLYLTFLTENALLGGFDLKPRCAYVWGILKGYAPVADDVWQKRYVAKL